MNFVGEAWLDRWMSDCIRMVLDDGNDCSER